MRFIGCLAFYLVLVFSLSAQDVKKAPGGVISGNLFDSISQKAITGASVLLTNLPEGKNYTTSTAADVGIIRSMGKDKYDDACIMFLDLTNQ